MYGKVFREERILGEYFGRAFCVWSVFSGMHLERKCFEKRKGNDLLTI